MNQPTAGSRPRANVRDPRARLRKVKILIADPDERFSTITYTLLRGFGFDSIDLVHDGATMLQILRDKDIDLLICEWDLKQTDGIKLIQTIRTEASNNWQRDLPAIILTGKADLESVRTARDAGFTEFVAKPFSARSLSTRLLQMIDNPRQFVISPKFNGPDRRRRTMADFKPELDRRSKQAATQALKGGSEMSDAERIAEAQTTALSTMNEAERVAYNKATTGMTEAQRMAYIRADATGTEAERAARTKVKGKLVEIEARPPRSKEGGKLVEILPPNRRLIQLIGEDVSGADVFSDKMIETAQAEVKKKETEFLEWADNDIRMLEACYAKLKDDHKDDESKAKLLAAAYSLKSQAGIFGYDMGTEVSRMLLDYLPPEKPINAQSIIVLRKFLDTIGVVFRLKVKEAGGEIGAALIKGLQILTKKLG